MGVNNPDNINGLSIWPVRLCLILNLFCFSVFSHGTDIVAHPSSPVDELNEAQLRAIFSLQMTRWSDGSPIIVLRLAPSNPAHKAFCKHQLKILPQQLEAVWERLVFTGQRPRPMMMSDEKEMMSAIASTPGAIGYITGNPNHDVKIKTLPVNP